MNLSLSPLLGWIRLHALHLARPVRRTRLGAWIDARRAVAAGVSLPVYLRHRLSAYDARLPRFPGIAPPFVLEVRDHGAVERVLLAEVVDPRLDALGGADGTGEITSSEAAELAAVQMLNRADAIELQRRLAVLQDRQQEIENRRLAIDGAQASNDRAIEDARANGSILPRRTARRSDASRQAPVPPTPWLFGAAVLGVAGVTLAETSIYWTAFADQLGLSGNLSLVEAFRAQRQLAVAVAGSTLGAAAALVLSTHAVLHRWQQFFLPGASKVRAALEGLMAAGVATALVVVLAHLRHGAATGAVGEGQLLEGMGDAATRDELGFWAWCLLTLAPAVVGAILLDTARAAWRAHSDATAQYGAWKSTENARVEHAERLLEEKAALARQRSEVAREGAALEARVRRLRARTVETEAAVRRRIDQQTANVRACLHAAEAAVHVDSLAFRARARATGNEGLVPADEASTTPRQNGIVRRIHG